MTKTEILRFFFSNVRFRQKAVVGHNKSLVVRKKGERALRKLKNGCNNLVTKICKKENFIAEKWWAIRLFMLTL
ncbi:MAG: hypothetical protein IJ196_06185 [Prevotella sp.]|nr:hypothetical protein [Prevotella sp.]